MSIQDLILNSLTNLQSNDDLRGAFQHIINSGVGQFAVGSTDDQKGWHPSVDIIDTKNNIYVYVELPGIHENSISIDFFNNKLSISGEKIKKHTTHSYTKLCKQEIVYGKFNRELTLPINVTNQKNVTINYENGILTLSIDKKKEEQNRFSMNLKEVN